MRVVVFLLALCASRTLALWPKPRQITTGTETLKLSPSFSIGISHISNAPADLKAAVTRTQGYLKNDKLRILMPDRGESSAEKVASAPALDSLVLSLDSNVNTRTIAYEATLALEDRKEGYALKVPTNGSPATLTAATTLGLLRGLTTFSQIWFQLSGDTYTLTAPFEIVDSPAFPYRGFMLDTARN